MAQAESELHAGSGFPLPAPDKSRPPHGEVTWVDGDERIVSTSGPSIQLFIDLYIPRCAHEELFVVIRLRDTGGYLPAGDPEYRDDFDHLSVTAVVQMPSDGTVDQLEAIIPYVVMHEGSGGLMEAEIAVFDDEGTLVALSYYPIELPDDIDRSPDLLTVMAHTLVTLLKMDGGLQRDDVRLVRSLLIDNFDLDDLGDAFLRRILKIANQTPHSTETLAEVINLVVPASAHDRFVNLIYVAAKDDDERVSHKKRVFIERLLKTCDIHDHRANGPAGLSPYYEVLDLEHGVDLVAIKRQYKRLVRAYHPDRVVDLAPGFTEYATRRTVEFNKAYSALKTALTETTAEATVEIDFD